MSEAADALFPERFVPGEMHGLIEAEHLARYRWASTWVAGRRVLDAGCGVGYGSLLMVAAGAASVTGVDISQETVDAANEGVAHDAQFVVGDLAALPLEDASFDVIVCFETIEHVHDQDVALDELRRVLTRDGLLIVSSPNRRVYQEGNPYHTREYTPEELHAALSDRFANVELERQQAWLISMICDDETFLQADPNRALDIELRKIVAIQPGRETFTLAVASDADLPVPSALAMLTDLSELVAWRERARSAEEHLERARQAAQEAETAYQSMSVTYASTCKDYENALAALETRQRESSHQERSLQHTSTMLAERNAALRLAAGESAEVNARVAELETRLGTSTAALAELRSSLSWRITAPLRVFSRGRQGA